jgi:hypothetical protein
VPHIYSAGDEAKGGKFCINSVTGPDEYKAVVNDHKDDPVLVQQHSA